MFLELRWHVAVNKFNINMFLRTLFRQGSFFILIFSYSVLLNSSELIDEIEIIGNKKTKVDVILREIMHPIPSKFDSLTAAEDRNRIYNLKLFSTVRVFERDNKYIIKVNESPQYYPIPLIDHEESKGWSYGLGLVTNNFRGRNESIIAGAMVGQNPTYFLYYKNPWIGEKRIELTIDLLDINSKHHVYDSLLYTKAIYVGSGIQFNDYNYLNGQLGINQYIVKSNSQDIKSSNLKYIFTNINYFYDSRNIKIDPTIGLFSSIDISSDWHIDKKLTNHSIKLLNQFYFLTLSNYKIEPVFSYTVKGLIQIIEKNLPYYKKEYLGGENYVRGYSRIPQENDTSFQKYIEVVNLIYQSIESQFTIFKRKDIGGIEIGLDGSFFVDYGVGGVLNKPLQNTGLFGYGFGFRIFISGVGPIKLDFGFNPLGNYIIHVNDSN